MALFWSLPCILEILGNIYIEALHSVTYYDIGKKAIFVRFCRFFIVGTKLPFWNELCRFRDINCRFEDKLPF